jgi:hypothetical protein
MHLADPTRLLASINADRSPAWRRASRNATLSLESPSQRSASRSRTAGSHLPRAMPAAPHDHGGRPTTDGRGFSPRCRGPLPGSARRLRNAGFQVPATSSLSAYYQASARFT